MYVMGIYIVCITVIPGIQSNNNLEGTSSDIIIGQVSHNVFESLRRILAISNFSNFILVRPIIPIKLKYVSKFHH
jgi:hypothetical protein